jgi:hypothetical protein
VVQKLLRRARHGERVVFIPGNHDEAVRDYCGIIFGDIEVVSELIHETADGRRFLLIHGDEFDQVTRHHRWVAILGDKAYDCWSASTSLAVLGRRKLGISGYWSLAGYAKRKVKTALNFIFDFEDSAIHARPRARAGWRHLRPYPLGRRSAKSTASPTSIAATGSIQLHGHRRAPRRSPRTGRVGYAPAAARARCATYRTRACGGLNAHPDGV